VAQDRAMPVFIYFLSFLTKGVRAMNSETEILAEASKEENLFMKKLLSLILCLILCLSLFACNSEETQTTEGSKNTQQTESTEGNEDDKKQEDTSFVEPTDPDYLYVKSLGIDKIVLEDAVYIEDEDTFHREYILQENYKEMKIVLDYIDTLVLEDLGTSSYKKIDSGWKIYIHYTDQSSIDYFDYGRNRIRIFGDYDKDGEVEDADFRLISVGDNMLFKAFFESLE
jgi:uncharacterized lipoprotein YehR (DUF1307 family)